jgi:hypothetical protein
MPESTDPMSCIRYRIAYGEAARLIEMAKYDHAWGRDFAARIEKQSGKILAEVIDRVGDRDLDAVKEAVDDALAGRRPRW